MSDRHLVEIDGSKFVIVKASAEDQRKIMRIIKRYGITMDILSTAVLTDGLTALAALVELDRHAPDEDLDFIEEKMLFIVETESGENIDLDTFHCNWSLKERLFMEALQVNFGDFFEYLGLSGALYREMKIKLMSQNETTG